MTTINPSQLKTALAKLNIPVGEQIRYANVAQSLGIIPKKIYKGKETKQLLKEGSQKYKEFVYNEVLKKYNLALEAEAENLKQKKVEKKVAKKVVKKPKLISKKLVESLKAKFYEKYNFRYEGNDTLEDLYNAIKDNLNGGTYVNIAFRDSNQNVIYWRSLLSDYLTNFDKFEEEVSGITEGKFGSDPIDTTEYTLDFNLFSIGSVKIAQTGKSDDILFSSKMIESKDGLCAHLCLLECGFDCNTKGIKPPALRDFNKLVYCIKEYKLPIVVYSNGFTISKPAEQIVTADRQVEIGVADKKRERKYTCAELTADDIDFVVLAEPDTDEETGEYLIQPKHYLVYDEVNQHLDYLNGLPKLLEGVYLSVSNKVIKNKKVIFSPKQANINNKRVQKAPIEYIFFDYETVIDFNNSNCMQSYSVSALAIDNFTLKKLEEFDAVADTDAIAEIRKNNCFTFLGYDCGREFVNWFLERSLDKVCVFVGFNNTNFDNFLALEDFLRYNEDTDYELNISDIFYNGTQLLNFKIAGCHSFFDIRKHLVGSLKANCKSFKIESVAKKDCDHAEMQRLHDAGELINYITTDDKLKEYNEYDVLATAVLYRRYVNALDSIEATKPYAQSIHTIKTIGSLIYRVFEDNKKKMKFDLPKLEYQQYDDLQKSKIAGRVEMFNGVQKVDEQLVSTDVCSLYPYVMSVLNCHYPCGKQVIEVDEYKGDSQLGFYYCDIDQSCLAEKNLPNIYAKKNAIENDWGYKGVLENYLISNVMIGLLRKFGCTVVIKNGFIFPQKKKSCEMFGFLLDFMKAKNEQDTLSKQKDNAYNPALRETLKLLMNSLSGKVIEGLHTEKTVDVDNVAEYLKIAQKSKSINFINTIGGKLFLTYEVSAEEICDKQQRPIYLGVLIYDYAKRYMYENSYSKIGKDRLLYTDTDASKFRYSDFVGWKNWIDTNNIVVPHWEEVEEKDPRYKTHKIYEPNSKVFGSFEDELEDCVGDEYLFYCLEKKSWLYSYKKDGKWKSKYRFKGLNGGAQLLGLDEPFVAKKICANGEEVYSVKTESEIEVYRYYESHKENNIESDNEIKFFERVYSTGVAYILNSSFRKIVKNSARNVGVEDTENYNNLMNKIQVQFVMKKINIYNRQKK
jgi:hypothetical protein